MASQYLPIWGKAGNVKNDSPLVSRSEYPRDKPFLLTNVSYLNEYMKREKKIPQALSELPANWPSRLAKKAGQAWPVSR